MVNPRACQYLYQLNDPHLENHLTDRLSFRRFREARASEDLVEELFDGINDQLEAKVLLLRQGTVFDATIIDSVNRRCRTKT